MAPDTSADPPLRRINRRTFALEVAELASAYALLAAAAVIVTERGMLDPDVVTTGFLSAAWIGALGVRWATVARLWDLDRSDDWSLIPLAGWVIAGTALVIMMKTTAGVDAERLALPLSWIWLAPGALFAASLVTLLALPGTGDNRYAPRPAARVEWLPWRTNRATYVVDLLRTLVFVGLFTTVVYLWAGRGAEAAALHACFAVFNTMTVMRAIMPRLRDAERGIGTLATLLALIAAAEALRIWALANGEWRVLGLVGALWIAALLPPLLLPTGPDNEYGPAKPKGVERRKLFFWFSPWPPSAAEQRPARPPNDQRA